MQHLGLPLVPSTIFLLKVKCILDAFCINMYTYSNTVCMGRQYDKQN
jgi:hypothetical protein